MQAFLSYSIYIIDFLKNYSYFYYFIIIYSNILVITDKMYVDVFE